MRKNFTMIEMIIVVLLIALLAAVAAPVYFNYLKDAKKTAAVTQIRHFMQALQDYEMRLKKKPTTEQGLEILVRNVDNQEGWRKFLNAKGIPLDPWGNEYVYEFNTGENTYEIISYGEDGKPGGEGDAADISSKNI